MSGIHEGTGERAPYERNASVLAVFRRLCPSAGHDDEATLNSYSAPVGIEVKKETAFFGIRFIARGEWTAPANNIARQLFDFDHIGFTTICSHCTILNRLIARKRFSGESGAVDFCCCFSVGMSVR
jgi:hypothetical protein